MKQITTKPEEFLQIQDGDEWCVYSLEDEKDLKDIGSYFKNNVDVGEEVTVKVIKGTRWDDGSGNYNYSVKEISESTSDS